MPRKVKPLTNTAISNAKPKEKQFRLTDGDGLYLLVMPSGAKYWRLDYTLHDKRRTLAIGKFPAMKLRQARAEREKARDLITGGVDPVQYRKSAKSLDTKKAANNFESLSTEWFKMMVKTWTHGHSRTVKSRLRINILPWIGPRPITEITAPEILTVLRRIENKGAAETAHRCKIIISQVFRYAIATGAAERDPAADLRGALAPTRKKPMAAITDPGKAGELMRAIKGYKGDIITRCALRLSAFCFCRPGEIRHAEWTEINWIKQEWLIPADKMKMRRDHTVPLADQVIKVLQEIHPLTGEGKYIFPSLRTGSRPMSNNTILGALRRMGFSEAPPAEREASGSPLKGGVIT